jgi:Uma2 family endonuclease
LLFSATDARRHDRFWDGADIALEIVSKDKPERDLVDKRSDYAEAGIPEYWIVKPLTETISVLRLVQGVYEEAGNFRRGQPATSILRPDFSVAVEQVFDACQLQTGK